MSDTSGVPKIKRAKSAARLPISKACNSQKLKFPSRFRHNFPAPDDEPFDGVDQMEFAVQYLVFVVAVFIVTALVAAFIFVPFVGRMTVG
jgi:hypothetical protein